MKQELVFAAAFAVATNLPISASEVTKIAKEYGCDKKEVMTQVTEMLQAKQVAKKDMKQ